MEDSFEIGMRRWVCKHKRNRWEAVVPPHCRVSRFSAQQSQITVSRISPCDFSEKDFDFFLLRAAFRSISDLHVEVALDGNGLGK